MRQLFILACLLTGLAWPGMGYAGWTKVQQKVIAVGATCDTVCTIDFDTNTTTNNLVVIAVEWQSTTTTLTCSGDAATGWTSIAGSLKQAAGFTDSMQFCFGLANSGNTATVTFSVGNFSTYAVAFEYSGNVTTSIIDKSGSAEGTTETRLSAGTLTPDTDNELLLVMAWNDSNSAGSWTKATGWTAVQYTPGAIFAVADYQGFTPAGATEFYIDTSSTTNGWLASGVSFRPLVGGCKGSLTLLGIGSC